MLEQVCDSVEGSLFCLLGLSFRSKPEGHPPFCGSKFQLEFDPYQPAGSVPGLLAAGAGPVHRHGRGHQLPDAPR